GVPSSPRRKAITESGISYLVGFSSNSAGATPAPTRCKAKSPTTLDDGVTLVGRPSISYAVFCLKKKIAKQLAIHRAEAWARRVDSLTLVISGLYIVPIRP